LRAELLTGISEEEIAERLLAELRVAVELRKVSDVPVGVFLSGGIDSSTNAALFSEGEGGQVKTFSVGNDRDYRGCASELPMARAFASTVRAEHHERVLTQNDFLDFLPRMVHLQDEPIADPVCMPVYYVSKLARDNVVIVCLNYRTSDINCALGIEQLKRIETILHMREAVAREYHQRLGSHPNLRLPPLSMPQRRLSWFVYVIRLGDELDRSDRDWIAREMTSRGIGCGRYFAPIHQQPIYRRPCGIGANFRLRSGVQHAHWHCRSLIECRRGRSTRFARF